jgi:hypothetical protein
MEVQGNIVNFSGRGMQVVLPDAVPVSSVIQVELDGTLYFGDVCYCYEDKGRYRVGLQLEQVLTVSNDLNRLMQALQAADQQLAKTPTPAYF